MSQSATDDLTADAIAETQPQSVPTEEEKTPAPELSRAEEKKLALKYIIFAVITLAGVYIVQLFHLFDKLFDRIYYGNLTMIFYYICNAVFWIPFIVVLYKQIKKHTGYKVFRLTHTELPLKRSLVIYACTVIPIFIVSAALGFQLKIVFELGKRMTGMQLIVNASSYLHGGIQLILAVIIIELVQEAGQLLYKGKYCDWIPWGGIALAVVYGFTQVAVYYAAGVNAAFSWLYIAFDLLYGVIYLISKKNFYVTYFVSLILYIL